MRNLKIISAALLLAFIAGLSGQARADSWMGSSAYGTGTASVGADGHYAYGRSAVGVLLGKNQTLNSYSVYSVGSMTSFNATGDNNSFEGNSGASSNSQSPVSTTGSISGK